MQDSPTVSTAAPSSTRSGVVVVIPYYNGAKFIERSLNSVFAQTLPADEVIVVNDGSRPEERDFLEQIAPRYAIRIIDQENGGQGAARNTGVRESVSPYICFLDQDDFYLPNHIKDLVAAIPADEPNFGFVYADLAEAEGDGKIVRWGMVKDHAEHPKTNLHRMLRDDLFILPSASLFGRHAFEAVGGFDTQFMGYEDDDLSLRLFRAGFTNHFLDKPVTVWCIHTESTSFNIRMVRSRFKYFMKLVRDFPDQPRFRRFFLRECFMPRFGRYFVDHVIEAVKADDPNRAEMSSILRQYADIVLANPAVGRKQKLKLRAVVFMVENSPPGLIRAVGSFTRLPGVRNLRGLLG